MEVNSTRKMYDLESLNEEYAQKVRPTTVIYIIVAALGGLGNISVILVYCFRMKKQDNRYFIPILACVDLIGCVTNAVYFHLDDATQFIYPSDILCRLLSFMVIFNNGVSGHIILVIALQRYLILCRPFGRQLNRPLRRLAIVVICLLSLLYASPVLFSSGKLETIMSYNGVNVTTASCTYSSNMGSTESQTFFRHVYFGVLLALILLNIIVTGCLYFPVIRKIYHTFSRLKRMSFMSQNTFKAEVDCETPSVNQSADDAEADHGDNCTIAQARMKNNMSVTLLVIIIVYMCSFLPSLVTQTLALGEPEITDTMIHFNLYYFFLRFYLFNHVLNPFIYICFDVKFRRELKNWCCVCL